MILFIIKNNKSLTKIGLNTTLKIQKCFVGDKAIKATVNAGINAMYHAKKPCTQGAGCAANAQRANVTNIQKKAQTNVKQESSVKSSDNSIPKVAKRYPDFSATTITPIKNHFNNSNPVKKVITNDTKIPGEQELNSNRIPFIAKIDQLPVVVEDSTNIFAIEKNNNNNINEVGNNVVTDIINNAVISTIIKDEQVLKNITVEPSQIPLPPPLPNTILTTVICSENPIKFSEQIQLEAEKHQESIARSLFYQAVENNKELEFLAKVKLNQEKERAAAEVANAKNNTDVTKIPVETTLINASGKSYKTCITAETTLEDLTADQFTLEMVNREFIRVQNKEKEDGEFKKVSLLLKENKEYVLNETKNGTKLTEMGHTYFSQVKKDENITDHFFQKKNENNNYNFKIVVPPASSKDLFVETGKQKHLIVVLDALTGKYYAIGYLTSKTTEILLSPEQYKKFQVKKEKENQEQNNQINKNQGESFSEKGKEKILGKNEEAKEKPQFFVSFKQANEIPSEQIQIVKYSEIYMETFSAEVSKTLVGLVSIQKQQEFIIMYDTQGVTKEYSLEMCKQFDIVAQAKIKNTNCKEQHPLSENQKKKNQLNKDQQQNKTNDDQQQNKPTNNVQNLL